MRRVLKPYYYDEFKCIGSECEDHCCKLWNIDIDKEIFYKYRKLNSDFGIEINKNVKRNRKAKNDNEYGRIQLDSRGNCPLLDSNNLCTIHKELGEKYLSHTCKTYPRLGSKFNDLHELSLAISCPEVCRKVLLNKRGITFDYVEEESPLDEARYLRKVCKAENEIYNLFWELRSVSISIMQYRNISIWKRLIIIAMIGENVQEALKENNIEKCYILIDKYKNIIEDKNILDSFDNIPTMQRLKFPFVKSILEVRTNMGIILNDKFNKMCINFNEVMGFDEGKSLDELINTYGKLEDEYYSKFLMENDYIIENYLVYNIYNNFMCGLGKKDIYNEVVKLVAVYSVLRMLLTTTLAVYEDEFKEENLIEVFYSFARVIEHNEEFLNKICNDMKELGYDKLSYLTILIK